MVENIEFVLSKNKLKILQVHAKLRKYKQDSVICPVCHKALQTNDVIIKDNRSYIHRSCYSKYRYDIPDTEATDEELENFFTIVN
jgi:ssDNA-binding Zn-finger/Zn-ribbon topoisomerase 1